MQSLDAALAFGITMLTLAMVVTTLVETVHRMVGLREKGLAILLANFYERVLVARGAGRPGDAADRHTFVEMMTANRGPVGVVRMPRFWGWWRHDTRPVDRRFLNRIWSGRRLGSLPVDTFMERLGSSPHGARMVMQLNDAGAEGLELLLKDVVQKFDAFGRESSEYFESRARLLSVLVGFLLAIALNVNAFAMFSTFMKRPDVTRAVIANGQQVTDAYRALEQKVETLDTTAATALQSGAGDTADDAAARRQVEDLRAQVQRAAAEADAAVKNLQAVGVPIGWTAQSLLAFRQSWVLSGLGVLLGGLLIGLGAPFWYRAVQTLTGIRNTMRGSQEAAGKTPAVPPTPSGPNQPPATPIEAFHAAFGAVVSSGDHREPEEAVG